MFSNLFRRRTKSTTGNSAHETPGGTDHAIYSNHNEIRDDCIPQQLPQSHEERPLRYNSPAATSPSATHPESPMRIGGYLLKKGHNFKVWKRRFFMFQGDQLEYRKDPDSPSVIGCIPLRHFEIDEINADSKDFTIITPGRHFFLRAETLQSKSNWLNELRLIQKQLQPLGTRPNANSLVPVAPASTADDHASVHCAKCKASFSLLRRKQLCAVCGYYYCSSAPCFNSAQRACTNCAAAATTAAAAAAAAAAAPAPSTALSATAAKLLLPDSALAHLSIRVVEARDLRPSDRRGSADPVVVIYAGTKEYRTAVKQQTLCPYWDEQFEVPLDGCEDGGLQLCVFDSDRNGRNAFMGMVHIPLARLRPDVLYDNWFPLRERPAEADDVVGQDGEVGNKQIPGSSNLPGGGNNPGPACSTSTQTGANGQTTNSGTPEKSGLRNRLQSLAMRKLPFFSVRGAGKVQGLIRLQLAYTYSPLTLLDLTVEESARAALSKKLFSLNVRRAKRLWRGLGIKAWVDWYRALMQWRRPLHTITAYIVYNVFVLFYPSEYLAVLPPLLLLCVLLGGLVDRVANEEAYAPLGDDEGVYRMWEYRNGGAGVGSGEGVYDAYEAWRALRSADEEESEREREEERERGRQRAMTLGDVRERGGSVSAGDVGMLEDKSAVFKAKVEQKTQKQKGAEEDKRVRVRSESDGAAKSEIEEKETGEDPGISFAVARELLKEEQKKRVEESEGREKKGSISEGSGGVLQTLRSIHEPSEAEEDGSATEDEDAEVGVSGSLRGDPDDDYLGEDEDLDGDVNDSDNEEDMYGRLQTFIPSVERQRAGADQSSKTTTSDGKSPSAPVNPADVKAEKVSFLAQARRYHHIMTTVQNAIGDACSVLERVETVLTWRDSRRASMLSYLCVLAIIIVIVLPLRVVLFVIGIDQITSYFRRRKLVKTKYSNKLQRFINSAPPLSANTLNNQSLNPLIPTK